MSQLDMSGNKIEVVTDGTADSTVAREIARTGSDTRRALDGYMLTSGVTPGGGGNVTYLGGAAPFTITPQGDGTAILEVTGAGASIEGPVDGVVTLVVEVP